MWRSISPSSAEIVLALLGRGQHGGERQAQRDPSRTSSDDRGPAPRGRLFAPSDRRWHPFIDRHLDLSETSGDVAASCHVAPRSYPWVQAHRPTPLAAEL